MSIYTKLLTHSAGMDKAYGRASKLWLVGLRTPSALYLLDPRLYKNTAEANGYAPETEHTFNKDSYFELIKHETGHEAFGRICGIPSNKLAGLSWFNEGVQFYMAGQLKKESNNFNTD